MPQDRDIITFSVMSFITQIAISLMITLAASGSLWSNAAAYNAVSGQLAGDFNQRGNQTVITETQINGTVATPTNPLAAISDYLGIALNILGWVGNSIIFIARVGLTYITLSPIMFSYAYQTGGMGAIIISIMAFIVVIWQAATLRYLIKFISGSRLGL